MLECVFFFQADNGIRDAQESRGLGDVYKRQALSTETQAAFLTAATLQHFEAGQVIYIEGEPANYVYILERGWVKSTRMTHEGREQGLLFLRPVEIFGDIAVFTEKPYPGTVTAVSYKHLTLTTIYSV